MEQWGGGRLRASRVGGCGGGEGRSRVWKAVWVPGRVWTVRSLGQAACLVLATLVG